jgi:hypothetical protein
MSEIAEKKFPYETEKECKDEFTRNLRNGIIDLLRQTFDLGMEYKEKEMMKDAVEGNVCGRVVDHINVRVEGYNALTPSNIAHIPCERKNFCKFKIGDKVKVILLKIEI